jgi:hypothetical protein
MKKMVLFSLLFFCPMSAMELVGENQKKDSQKLEIKEWVNTNDTTEMEIIIAGLGNIKQYVTSNKPFSPLMNIASQIAILGSIQHFADEAINCDYKLKNCADLKKMYDSMLEIINPQKDALKLMKKDLRLNMINKILTRTGEEQKVEKKKKWYQKKEKKEEKAQEEIDKKVPEAISNLLSKGSKNNDNWMFVLDQIQHWAEKEYTKRMS